MTRLFTVLLRRSGSAQLAALLLAAGSGCGSVGQVTPTPSGDARALVVGALADEEWEEVSVEDASSRLEGEHEDWQSRAFVAGAAAWTAVDEHRTGPAYPLDALSRAVVGSESRPVCWSKELLDYGGTTIRYRGSALINPAFRDHLRRFEEIVGEVAQTTYGRRPVRLRHRGAFACRSRRGQPTLLSEHALGNAIDVTGFEFGHAGVDAETTPAGTPIAPFLVSVASHWQSRAAGGADERHCLFLHLLVARLLARGDVFRGIITPADAAHTDHFHFDMAPRSYVRL
jgi:hypothetical protein